MFCWVLLNFFQPFRKIPSAFYSRLFAKVMYPYDSADTTAAWKISRFILQFDSILILT